jgi:predicted transcriptional regulator
LEIYYIAKYQLEYNIKEGDGRADHSIKTREVLRQSTKKQWQDTDIRKMIQKPVICLETGEIFESINTAAENVGIHRAGISMAFNGKQRTAGGCHWEYLNKEDKVSEETSYNLGCANRGKKQSAEQIAKRVAHLKGKHRTNFGNYKSVICIETGEIFKSVKIAGEQIGVHQTLISKVLHGEKKTAGGYHWKFTDAESPPKYLHENTHKKSVMCVETQKIFPSIKETVESLGLKNKNGISAVLNNRQKTSGGYHWKLIEKETDKND